MVTVQEWEALRQRALEHQRESCQRKRGLYATSQEAEQHVRALVERDGRPRGWYYCFVCTWWHMTMNVREGNTDVIIPESSTEIPSKTY